MTMRMPSQSLSSRGQECLRCAATRARRLLPSSALFTIGISVTMIRSVVSPGTGSCSRGHASPHDRGPSVGLDDAPAPVDESAVGSRGPSPGTTVSGSSRMRSSTVSEGLDERRGVDDLADVVRLNVRHMPTACRRIVDEEIRRAARESRRLFFESSEMGKNRRSLAVSARARWRVSPSNLGGLMAAAGSPSTGRVPCPSVAGMHETPARADERVIDGRVAMRMVFSETSPTIRFFL